MIKSPRQLLAQLVALLLCALFSVSAFADGSTSAKKNASGASEAAKKADASPASPRADLEKLLSGYHGTPEKKLLETHIKEPQGLLREIAADPQAPPLQRRRALEALSYYADKNTEAFYAELLQNDAADELLRHRVMGLISANFPDAALKYLQPFLGHEDLQFRLSAIDAIQRLPGEDALEALQRALKTEKSQIARGRLSNSTRRVR